MRKLYIYAALVTISACNNPVTKDKQEQTSIYSSGDTVFVPAASPVYTRIKTQIIEKGEFQGSSTTSGVVKPLSGHLAEITTPYEGRVVKSFVTLGQKVNKGTPLFEVSSSDHIESVRMFLQAKREKELATVNFKRKEDLLQSGVCSKKEYDEAKLQSDLTEKEFEKTAAILKIFNLDPDDADLTKPLVVRSPISGEVVKNDITVGQFISAESSPIVTVADLNQIWVMAHVREKDLGSLTLQDQVNISTESQPDNTIRGSVDYIGDMMNEQTRSVEVYVKCDNGNRVLKPGMFVTVNFSHKLNNALVVPASSVLQDQDEAYLYVQADPGVYVRKNVSVSSMEKNSLVVLSGLETGCTIVSEGGMYLR